MDSSPSKRRRTSPSTSVAVTVENTDLRPSPQNGPSPSRRRLSFMSPTKASLARFHPNLLSRAKSAEPPRPVSKGLHDTIEQNPVAAGGTNSTIGHLAGTTLERLKLGNNGVESEQGPLATPRGRSQTPGDEDAASTAQVQYSMNPDPRASPPEEAIEKGGAANGTNGGHQEPVREVADTGMTAVSDSQISQHPSTPTQREPHVPTSGMGIGDDGEPTLPSTPSQLGLEPPWEKPKGPMFSSPSKRPRRKGRSSAKSSPLKPPDNPLEHPNQKQKSSIANLGPRRYIKNTPKPPPPPEEAHLRDLQSRLNKLEKQLQDIEDKLLRQMLVSSRQQEGSKEEKTIAKQKREVSQQSTKVMLLRDEVLRFQATQSIDHVQTRPEETGRSTKPSSLTQRLASFLPFSMKPPTVPRPSSPKDIHINQGLDWDILQTAAAAFTITTSNTLLLPPTVDNELLQRQDINLSTSQCLLTSDLRLTANTITQQISHVDVRAISSWAEPELGSWLRQSMEKMELTALGRAFGRYWEVATLRGKCWISCKQDFENLVANAPESNSPLLYLGMQDLIFVRSNVQLKVSWRIFISERGEVESHSSAHPRFPAAWQQEANSELTKIGDAFMMLVEDRGIPEAIGMICKVVFPT